MKCAKNEFEILVSCPSYWIVELDINGKRLRVDTDDAHERETEGRTDEPTSS